jgi:hypothetical protein
MARRDGLLTYMGRVDLEERANTFLDLLEGGVLGNEQPHPDRWLCWVSGYETHFELTVLGDWQWYSEVHELYNQC